MRIRFLSIVLALGCLAPCVFGQSAATEVHVKLSLAGDKQTYQIGEPIKILLEFTADREGYQANTARYSSESVTDTIHVSPESGASHWRKESLGVGYECVVSHAKLSKDPTRIEFVLNDSITFNSPGRYSIRTTTGRVFTDLWGESQRILLTSNEVTLAIEAMSEADEQKHVQRLSSLIDSTNDNRIRSGACGDLNFLTGDASSREKVRRFGSDARQCDTAYSGLFTARNRGLIIQLLEAEFRDETKPVTAGLLNALTKLRLLRERAGVPVQPLGNTALLAGTVDPRAIEIQESLVTELAIALSKRAGKSQTTTAMTILAHLPKEQQTREAMLREVRTILLQNFDSLHPHEQEYLTSQYWEQLRDASLIPSLKKMLSSTGIGGNDIRKSALKRLIEIAPDEARPFVIAELRDPTSFVGLEILGSIADKTLPEADVALAGQIRRFGAVKANDRTYLRHKTLLAARFATAAIYQDLMQIYRNAGSALPMDSRAGFLAYFARHNEPEALSLIEQTLEKLAPSEDFNVLPDFTRLYYSDRIDALLRKRLESDVPHTASTAAYLISLHGAADSQKVIEDRLERWRKDWSARRAEADSNSQGRVEIELIMALIHAKSWKPSPERARELQQSCVTQICRSNFRLN